MKTNCKHKWKQTPYGKKCEICELIIPNEDVIAVPGFIMEDSYLKNLIEDSDQEDQ